MTRVTRMLYCSPSPRRSSRRRREWWRWRLLLLRVLAATAWRKMTEKRSCLCGKALRQALAQMRVRTRRAAGAPCKWLSFFRCLRQDMMQRVKTPSAGTCWGTRVSWLLGSSRYRALESSIMHLKGLCPSYSIIHRVWHAISHILITMGFLCCCVLYSGDTADWSTQGTGARPSSPK